MFIISKRNFLIQRPGAEPYRIKKDFVGEIPDAVASHWLVRAAIASGTIATPQGTKDAELRESSAQAEELESEADQRPDAEEGSDMEGKRKNGRRKE